MNYYEITIGDESYKLRLNTRGCIEVEKRIGKNPLSVFANVNEANLPSIGDLVAIFQVAMKPYHKDIKDNEIIDLVDDYIAENSFVDFLNVIVEVLKTSGLFTTQQETNVKEKN